MSFSLPWRRLAVACVLLTAAAAILTLRTALPGAEAQEPVTATFVVSGIAITPSNGNANLGSDTGTEDGVFGIACTGAAPRSGSPNIPGQVVTQLTTADTRLRIMRNDGVPLSATVRINCVVEVEVPVGNATAERLKDAATVR
jgi:hypothetical protein